jgi:hypothetical protein
MPVSYSPLTKERVSGSACRGKGSRPWPTIHLQENNACHAPAVTLGTALSARPFCDGSCVTWYGLPDRVWLVRGLAPSPQPGISGKATLRCRISQLPVPPIIDHGARLRGRLPKQAKEFFEGIPSCFKDHPIFDIGVARSDTALTYI